MLKVNEYGGRQAKGNEKRQCFKGWETLVNYKHNSIKIVIESLSSYDDRKDEYIYEWKRDT